MSQERITQLYEQLSLLERKIRPLEWDSSRNQINEFKKHELARLKEEHATLSQELQGLSQ